MAKPLVFAKNKLSHGIKGFFISRAFVQGCSKLKSVSVKKSVSVNIGKFTKNGIGIGMFFLLDEKIGIGMLFLLEGKIGIGMLLTSQNQYRYR